MALLLRGGGGSLLDGLSIGGKGFGTENNYNILCPYCYNNYILTTEKNQAKSS